ncbi:MULTISPECIES: cbb3-type cytochrome c oxidase subunit 3 [Bradyrhizobium]|jgi:cytochrome c oxidase cbb3-type subunit IV|uniref:Cytochrome c oxidase cbb3-type subunit 4 n=1 Tax=Bradyrhizobium elkanii TaxID=29448 RepID=A0A4Q4KM07_BRAEL|nr:MULTISPECIES: cbb3-type cytochrome c oxidase subunit 3 [Bradyrhizobium]MBP1293777.1 cytochrome c oxidase cbb3-type subunit 4 [Bradyrhizobium elkanii]MBP2431766.1 cytochrome c oxidase cbb3-type subunit 4 [Bradyrhizobium elkanii]MCP1734604.1 cytochrome c oxidase cbb3-type subunit 4 [Bradyrhizobium elkanii]MCP1752705.1 cytochrome c oxidase cbb3-type subunit 4 [Bradyrhizobium elkanii]MCP1925639.1 cytochrome c oxidase cbb3-type subunit 4 [Bradyrhizobium elkanii]
MKAIIHVENFASSLVGTLWTPIFVGIFIAIVAYALWPRNKSLFDAAARMPLRED